MARTAIGRQTTQVECTPSDDYIDKSQRLSHSHTFRREGCSLGVIASGLHERMKFAGSAMLRELAELETERQRWGRKLAITQHGVNATCASAASLTILKYYFQLRTTTCVPLCNRWGDSGVFGRRRQLSFALPAT